MEEDSTAKDFRKAAWHALNTGALTTDLEAADVLLRVAQVNATLAVSAAVDQLRLAVETVSRKGRL